MNTDKCTGCRLCEKICPKQAISIKEKWLGFSYPEIEQDKCINCGLCEKKCPVNNIKPLTVKECYVGYNKKDIRLKSSSGGIFSELAEYVLSQNGIVFGAVFDKEWNVIITYTDKDITPMLGSKYVQADVKNTYIECKDFLDQGKIVLYSGSPCQIYGLKGFLKKDYDNLITMDIFCHGVPSPKVWQNYIKSLGKEIESINFRDKRKSWENFNLTIKFKDGTELSESKSYNEFMKLFLQNKILRKSCYDCKLRCNSIADISIGDAWGQKTQLNDNKGLSDIVINTEKGKLVFDNLDITKSKITYNSVLQTNCINVSHKIPSERAKIINMLSDNKNIAIVTDQVHQNIGGIIQAVALSDKIEEITGVKPHFVNQKNNGHKQFFDKHCSWTTKPITNETHMVVGSDQIWNRRFCNGVPFNDKYLVHDNINKIVYAASFGHHKNEFTKEELIAIHNSLSKVKYISTREISGTLLTKKWFGVDSIPVLDPTMLYDKEYYLNKINQDEITANSGIFAYILDNNSNWQNCCNKLSKLLNENILQFDKSCENFIYNFNKAKYIITDSYHGSVFSLIFNKPFICLRNLKRGNDRFDDLCIRFNLEERFVENLNTLNMGLFDNKPNVHDIILKYRIDSINYLKRSFNL